MEYWKTIRGLKIRYLLKGTGNPFVLLHGFSFFAETWIEMGLFDKLAEKYGKKTKKVSIDKQLLNDFTRFRDLLSKNITKINQSKKKMTFFIIHETRKQAGKT